MERHAAAEGQRFQEGETKRQEDQRIALEKKQKEEQGQTKQNVKDFRRPVKVLNPSSIPVKQLSPLTNLPWAV